MLIAGTSTLTVVFDASEIEEISGRTGPIVRIGPLFAVGDVGLQLKELAGREVQVAVIWNAREGKSRTFLNGRIVQIVSPLVLEPAAVEEPSPLEDQEPEAAKPKKTAKKEPKKRKALAQLLGE